MSSKIDTLAIAVSGPELLRRLKRKGCYVVRQRGSHAIVRCGRCQTVIPLHSGEDIKPGTFGRIKRDLVPWVGEEVFN